jgi:hypothetical protein
MLYNILNLVFIIKKHDNLAKNLYMHKSKNAKIYTKLRLKIFFTT